MRSILGLFLLAGTGCSAHEACVDELPYDARTNLTSDALSGSATLNGKDEATQFSLRLRVTELPKLWLSDGNIANGKVNVTFAPTYDGSIRGDDGVTEMPRISATLSVTGTPQAYATSSSAFPSGSSEPASVHLFDSCGSPDFDGPECCPFGSQECTIPLTLVLKRLDGPPLPPVVVTYTADAAASTSSCPLGSKPMAKMALEESAR